MQDLPPEVPYPAVQYKVSQGSEFNRFFWNVLTVVTAQSAIKRI